MEERRLKFFLALQDEVEKSKNLSADVKEKFYVLAGKHLHQDHVNVIDDEDIDVFKIYREQGVIAIETDLEVSVKSKKKQTIKEDQIIDLNHHKPRDVNAFLSLFGSGDHPFKYLVHDYTNPGEIFDLGSFNIKVEKAFKLKTANKNLLPKYLFRRIEAFIGISNKPWYFRLIGQETDFSFRSERVKEWVQENPNTHPIFGFANEIKLFDASIRITGNLKEVLTYVLSSKNLITSFDIESINLDGANFYTDVDALASGLGAIFNSIAQRIKTSHRLRISFEAKSTSTGRLRILKITHIESRCNKILREDELLGGDLKDAKKYLYKLCDWSILSENPDPKINKLNILFDPLTNVPPREKVDEPIDGFTHVLTFYS